MAATTSPRWYRDVRFLIPTVISVVALTVPIIREDIIHRPTSKDAQLLISPTAVSYRGVLKLTIEGRGFHGDVDKRVLLDVVCTPGPDPNSLLTILNVEVLVSGDGAFTETAEVSNSFLKPGTCEVTAYRMMDRNGRPPEVAARRTSYKFTVVGY